MYLLVFFVFIVHVHVYVHTSIRVTFSRFASCTSVFRVAVAVFVAVFMEIRIKRTCINNNIFIKTCLERILVFKICRGSCL